MEEWRNPKCPRLPHPHTPGVLQLVSESAPPNKRIERTPSGILVPMRLSAAHAQHVSVTSEPSRAGTRSARLEEGGRPAGLSAPCEQSPTATVHRRLVVGRNLHAAARLRFLHSAVRRPGRGESLPGRVEGSHWLGAVLVTGRAGRPRKRAVLATASLTKVSSRTPGATLLKRGVGASADT